MPVRVKVCCIMSAAEARMAIAAGAHALGLVSAMPSGPGVIGEAAIAAIAAAVPPGVATVLLTSATDVATIIRQQHDTGVNTLQIVDRLPAGSHARLRRALPGIGLVQVIHVSGPESLAEAQAIAGEVDALLLDSGRPNAALKQFGGTGRVHDWRVSRQIRQSVAVPVFLAGGLGAGNVGQAIAAVRPYAVDLCSGLRRDGRLAGDRVDDFFAAVARVEAGRSPTDHCRPRSHV